MCGITGYFSRCGHPLSESLLKKMMDTLKHRGPDGEGIFLDDNFALGHRRLSIIDIDGGSQPMTNEDGSVIVIFNGEIYNYIELREELLSRNHHFRSKSDTEVIVHLYEEKGNEMFSHLNGMYAVAIADLRERQLILARDRFGEKPLFYYTDQHWVVFASEIKSIILHPAVPRELDCSALYDYLSLNYVPTERTMLKNVKRIMPGSSMIFSKAMIRQNVYWSFSEFQNVTNDPRSEDGAIDELDSLLSDSVRIRLRSDVPIGIFLSGGVDSSLVAWKTRELGADVCAFTASFGEKSFSEEKYAREIAKSLDMEIKVFGIAPDVDKILPSLIYHADEPLADSSALPVYLLSQNTSKSVKVVLGGDGGDETFAGYLTYQATLLAKKIRKCIPLTMIRFTNSLVNRIPVSDSKVSLGYKMKRFSRGLLMPPGWAHFSWNGTWCKKDKDNLLSDDFLSNIADSHDTYEYMSSRHNVDYYNPDLISLQIADSCEYLPNDILAKVDRMSMAHGLEVRSPWLDHRIVEWALRLPAEFKLKNLSFSKYLLKRYMAKRFPTRVANRPKQGFSVPIHQWTRNQLFNLTEGFLSEKALRDSGIFNAENVRKMLDLHYKKKESFGFEIWGLLIFMLWNKNFLTSENSVKCPIG